MKSVLEELYHGNICPADDCFPGDKQYYKLTQELGYTHNEMMRSLRMSNSILAERLEHAIDTQYRLSMLENCTTFIDGFYLGAKIMLEICQND